MNEPKCILQSKTAWGIIIAAFPSLVQLFGWEVGDVAALTADANSIAEKAFEAVGLAWAFYGRLKATGAVTLLPGAK